MKKFIIRVLDSKCAVKDDYGWEIPDEKAWDAYLELRRRLGASDLLRQLVKALSEHELAENLAFICRMNDEHIPQLEGYDEEKEFDLDNFHPEEIEEQDFKDSMIDLHVSATEKELNEFCDKYHCAVELVKNDVKEPIYRFSGNRDDLKKGALEFGLSEDEFEASVKDALIWPKKIENHLPGEGRLTGDVTVYKNFGIFETTDGKYDVYDKKMTIWKTGIDSIEEAKKDIDETVEEPDFKKKVKKIPGANVPKETIDLSGLRFAHYIDPEAEDDYWEVSLGGALNVGGSTAFGQYSSLKEAVDDMIKTKRLDKQYLNPPAEEDLNGEYTELKEWVDEFREGFENANRDVQKYEGEKRNAATNHKYAAAAATRDKYRRKILEAQQIMRKVIGEKNEFYSPAARKLRALYDKA